MDEFFQLSWSQLLAQTTDFHTDTTLPSLPQALPPPLPLLRNQQQDRSLKYMAERMRRKKHRQIYLALHQLLPPGTKSDANSIAEKAGEEIEGLQRRREELRKRNGEMERMMMMMNPENVEEAELSLKVEYPASGIDSMLEVLRCLRDAGCTASSIQSTFSHHQFAASLHFQTRMRAATEVEKAVQRSLFEAEMKLRRQH